MKDWKELLSSGMLELYVLGETTAEEDALISVFVLESPEIRQEIDQISLALERYALSHAVKPDPIVKPFLLATMDYMDRMQGGEIFSVPPVLNENSRLTDYKEWLDRSDMVLPIEFEDLHAKILSHTPEILTAIVWIKHMAPQEVHDHEFEKFLIVEGACEIHIETDIHQLFPGDYLSIPLYKKHHVLVTSDIPCKVILQRLAA
jgi:mannose-6-phosphate isomerase-like protein (cupin superfamily)